MKVKSLLNDQPKQNEAKKIPVQIYSPWANLIIKCKIPDEIFSELLNVYEDAKKLNKSFGKQLVGQVNDEPEVTKELQEKYPNWTTFVNDSARNFIMTQTSHVMSAEPEKWGDFLKDQLFTRVNTMWFVRQKPNEYNPVHIHTNCKVSGVAYLKTPKEQVVDRKPHYKSDGKITFVNNTGTDINFSCGQCTFEPVAGDMYIFGAMQHHMVWPYRSANPDDERVSISFNADMITQSKINAEKEKYEMEMKHYTEEKQKLENEKLNLNNEVKDDKSTDVSNVNKSG